MTQGAARKVWFVIQSAVLLQLPLWVVILNYHELRSDSLFASVLYASAFSFAASTFEPRWWKKLLYAAILVGFTWFQGMTFYSNALFIVFGVGLIATGDFSPLTFRNGSWKVLLYRVLRGIVAVLLCVITCGYFVVPLKLSTSEAERMMIWCFLTYIPLAGMFFIDFLVFLDSGRSARRKRLFS